MTYQVLARKWRPKTFNDMAGQEHVLQTLIHALDHQRLHHAYLFTGTRGVGKTTIARIFAKCLNCEKGVSSTPCGKCGACQQIAEGRFIDLIEVDAASKTKVEDTRELLENVQYAPSVGRYKVYLIDEVHMLSTHSFNALLKTLEEPPPHVIFLLATTDPHKLPITILSRCLQFSLKNLSPQIIAEYLKSVMLAEQIPFEEPALWSIARAAQGSMRDALTLLDQSISFCAGNVTEAEVSALLGTPDQALIFQVISALIAEDAPALLDTAGIIAARAFDYFMLLDNLLSTLHRIAIAQLVPGGIDNSQGDREQVLSLARAMTGEQVQLYYQIALNGRKDMGAAFDLRMAFEMLLLRLLVFSPQAPSVTQVAAGTLSDSVPRDSEQKKKPDDSPAVVSSPLNAVNEMAHADASRVVPQKSENTFSPEAPESRTESHSEQGQPESVSSPQDPVISDTVIFDTVIEKQAWWNALVTTMGLTGMTGNLLSNCVLEARTDDTLTLRLDETQSALYNREQEQRIAQALQRHLARPLEISIHVGALDAESPAQFRGRLAAEALERARQEFSNDEHVQALIHHFSAHIVPGSVQRTDEGTV